MTTTTSSAPAAPDLTAIPCDTRRDDKGGPQAGRPAFAGHEWVMETTTQSTFPDHVDARAIEYAPGKFAAVLSRNGKFEFRGGRVFSTAEAAEAACPAEVAFQKQFWGDQLANQARAVVAGGEHYRIGREQSGRPGDSRGFGGRTYHLRNLATGEVTTTSNLWRQGIIPDFARPQFPDTHEFVEEGGLQ